MPTRRRNAPRHPAVNSPAFKRWFGQSKVVDAQGEPLVVYHGTCTAGFAEFEPELSGTASQTGAPHGTFFFTDSTVVANTYTVAWQGKRSRRYCEGAGIYPVYLSLQRPLVVDLSKWAHAWTWSRIPYRGRSYTINELAEYARKRKYDGLVVRNVWDTGVGRPENDAGEGTTYVAFSPTQVKSATGNAGTFDPADPRITYNPARRRNPEDTTVLRLTGFRNKYGAAAEAFLRDLFDASYPNPLNPRERILAGIEVAVEVSPLRGGVHLDEVRALRPGKGEGTKAMRFLVELADKHGVTMTLFPMPFGDQKMDTDDLVRFYRKHGFRFESEEGDEEEADIDMIRFPRQTNPRGLDVRRGIPGTYRARFVAKGGRSRAYPAHAGAPWDKVMVRLASETTLSGGRMYDAVMQAAREGRTTLPGKRGAVSVQRVTNPRKVSR